MNRSELKELIYHTKRNEREKLMYHLGRESADAWLCELEEIRNLVWLQKLGDSDLIQYTLGRLSTLDDERM